VDNFANEYDKSIIKCFETEASGNKGIVKIIKLKMLNQSSSTEENKA
jgi:hypothetical protein